MLTSVSSPPELSQSLFGGAGGLAAVVWHVRWGCVLSLLLVFP